MGRLFGLILEEDTLNPKTMGPVYITRSLRARRTSKGFELSIRGPRNGARHQAGEFSLIGLTTFFTRLQAELP